MRRWTFSYERACVFSIECERYGYPHQDEHGNCQFENTHFDTEKEALEYLHKEAKACVFLCARSREEARKSFETATQRLADASEILAKVMQSAEVSCG